MDAKTFDKSKLPSRHVTEGPSRAPHRSYYYAMGLTEEQIHRPFQAAGLALETLTFLVLEEGEGRQRKVEEALRQLSLAADRAAA
jgi:hypothetical protein